MLPTQHRLFYGGAWHDAADGRTVDVASPATGQVLCTIAEGGVADVDAAVTVAKAGFRQDIFGPVLPVLRWSDEAAVLEQVNRPEHGLACSIRTNGLQRARRTAAAVEAGFARVNEVSKHFLGTPFGGFKRSGLGREECLEELLAFTQEKDVHIRFKPA